MRKRVKYKEILLNDKQKIVDNIGVVALARRHYD